MNSRFFGPTVIRFGALALGLLAAAPASAQWSRIASLPVTDVFAIRATADTIAAGVDTAVYVSTNAGASWTRSARPAPLVLAIDAVYVHHGRLYAGTLGQGVFVSDNLGASWQAFNEGLVGGFLDSQLDVSDLEVRGDSLFAATEGAGVYMRNLAAVDTWHHFGEEFEPNQASNVNDLALGGTRLVASGGGNGTIFRRDPGEADWTVSLLGNVSLLPGFQAQSAVWTGTGWVVGVVGANFCLFRSATGQEPWTAINPGLGALANAVFATRGKRILAALVTPNTAVMASSDDDGASWQLLEALPGVFVYQLAVVGTDLYAARLDGLWVRSIANVSVPGGAPPCLSFALVGAQPVGESARLRFELAEAGVASIEVFDVRGRRVGEPVRGSFTAGPHDLDWSLREVGPGVYSARLSMGGKHAVVRLVHVR